MKIIIKVGKDHFVKEYDVLKDAVIFTRNESEALVFKSEASVNHWLDQYANCGTGLNWGQDIKLRKFV